MLYRSRYEIYLEGIRTDIIKTLEKEEHTIESLRVKLGVNWKTVRDRLLLLQNEGVVCKRRVGRVKLYYLNPKCEKEEREP